MDICKHPPSWPHLHRHFHPSYIPTQLHNHLLSYPKGIHVSNIYLHLPTVCKYTIHGYVDGKWYMGISFHLVYIHKTELKSRFLPNLALSRPFFLCRMWGPKNCFPVAPALRTSDKFHEVTMEPEPSWYPWDGGNEGRSRKTTLRCWPWEGE